MFRLRKDFSDVKRFSYYLKEGISSVFIHGFMSFAAITVMAACLLIIGTFTLVAYNIDHLIEGLEGQNQIVVFANEYYTEEDLARLENDIWSVENIKEVTFISRDELLEDYLASLGDDAYIMEGFREDNPLRDGFRVTMEDVSLHVKTVEALEQLDGIENTNSQKDISDRLIQIRKVVNAVSYTLIALLGAVAIFIISNTVKLAMFSRQEEIFVMKMVGATNGFIRAPFIVEGSILGVLAGGLAYLAQWGVYQYITQELVEGSAVFAMMDFSAFSNYALIMMLAAGLFLGISGSILSIRRFLKV